MCLFIVAISLLYISYNYILYMFHHVSHVIQKSSFAHLAPDFAISASSVNFTTQSYFESDSKIRGGEN